MSVQTMEAGSGREDFNCGVKEEQIIGSWKNGHYKITLFISKIQDNKIKAFVENVILGTFAFYAPNQVKCGMMGCIPHKVFIQNIGQYERKVFEQVFKAILYSHAPHIEELWIVQDPSTITKDLEVEWSLAFLKSTEKTDLRILISHLEKVMAVQEQVGRKMEHLAVVVLELQQEIARESHAYT